MALFTARWQLSFSALTLGLMNISQADAPISFYCTEARFCLCGEGHIVAKGHHCLHLAAVSKTRKQAPFIISFMLDYSNPKLTLETASLEPGEVTWRSPSNLAIVKYWGKYGRQLPRNPSLSLTLTAAFTDTKLSYKAKASGDPGVALEFFFHEEPNEAFRTRMVKFLESILDIFPFLRQLELTIHSGNSFPHSSGIASSASAMSALALCLCSLEDRFFDTLNDDAEFDRKASYVARLGSGSACRSIYPRAALWGEFSEVAGSSDLYAVPLEDELHEIFKDFHDDILIVSSRPKAVSSGHGHELMEGHPFADARFADARRRLYFLWEAMKKGDLETFGTIAENEALTLHGLMMSGNPSFTLLKPGTLSILERIREYRKDSGNPVFFSLDAGPNVHVLYPENIIHEVRPFIEEELLPFCEEDSWLQDWVGEGPVEL